MVAGKPKGIPTFMQLNVAELVVVQPCTPHFCVVERKTKWLNKVKLGSSVRAKANDIARVRWDLRFYEHNVKVEGGLERLRLAY